MNTNWLTYGLIAALLYLGYTGLYVFHYDESGSPYLQEKAQVTSLQGEIKEKERKIEDAKAFFRTLKAKRAELRGLSQELISMKSTLSESLDLPLFMRSVLSEAKKVDLQITSLTPQKETKFPYYLEQPFDLNFSGVFVQLIAFMDRLSRLRNIIRVDDFSIQPKSNVYTHAKYIEVQGSLKVKTYVYQGSAEDQIGTGTLETSPSEGVE